MHFYNLVKTIHIICAIVSISGFFIRAVLKLCDSQLLQKRWIKITPHIIDTLLLVSAITLAVSSHQYPIQNSWLTAKVIALFVYIAMGIVVMRFVNNKIQQLIALLITLLTAVYIIAVAINKTPFPF